MNRRDEVKKVIGDWIVRKHQDTDGMCDDLDRIYGVLPDDGEMATYEWMRKVDAPVERVIDGCHLLRSKCRAQWVEFPVPITSGQFRRLCEALGVELQKRKDGEW